MRDGISIHCTVDKLSHRISDEFSHSSFKQYNVSISHQLRAAISNLLFELNPKSKRYRRQQCDAIAKPYFQPRQQRDAIVEPYSQPLCR
jgi:hypothetical protein